MIQVSVDHLSCEAVSRASEREPSPAVQGTRRLIPRHSWETILRADACELLARVAPRDVRLNARRSRDWGVRRRLLDLRTALIQTRLGPGHDGG